MKKRDKIIQYINEYLKIETFYDRSLNGVQIEGKDDVKKLLFAVSYSYSVGEYAQRNLFDMIVVHHGIFWDEIVPICGNLKKRIEVLIKNNITLAAYHIPLDAHPRIGNNMSIIKLFSCDKTKRFANYHGNKIGFIGYFKKPVSFEKIVKTVREEINPKPLILPFGKRDITSIAVISGSGSSFLKEAVKNKVDVFITGEAQEYVFETAKESYINFVAAAHYRTEVYGIKNLCKLVREKFKIETFFLDTNNPL